MNINQIVIDNKGWVYLLIFLFLSFGLFFILQKIISQLQGRLKQRHSHFFLQSFLNLRIDRPVAGILLSFLWLSFYQFLALPVAFTNPLATGLKIIQSLLFIRIAYLFCEAVGLWIQQTAQQTDNIAQQQLVPLIRKSLKVLVVLLGTLLLIQSLGFNVISLLAGLGLGGLALALAAQDTAANFFGSLMILIDKPFKVGDYIKITDTEGIVENIGFRSTRIRTFDRSLVTLPNSFVAKEKIDNLTLRDAFRIRHILGFTYSTPTKKLASYCEELRKDLSLNPKINKDDVRVFFQEMGDFNLQVLVQVYVKPMHVHEFFACRQEVLIQIMDLAEKRGLDFAFPTQTHHVLESTPTKV
jgi:MscS family membrane protein